MQNSTTTTRARSAAARSAVSPRRTVTLSLSRAEAKAVLSSLEGWFTAQTQYDCDRSTRSLEHADEVMRHPQSMPMTTSRIMSTYRKLLAAFPELCGTPMAVWGEDYEAEVWERYRRTRPELPAAFYPQGNRQEE
jgi:hypothetical protein